MALNNNQCATILNTAIAMATGAEEISTLDLSAIVDAGNDSKVIGERDQFTQALLNVITKNWFTDSSYRSDYTNHFFVEAEKFGAFVQAIHMEYPEAQASHAWEDFTATGSTRKTVGTYEVYTPVIFSRVYGKGISFEIPVTISDEQFNTAFHNATELATFVNYVMMMVDNALVMKLEEVDVMNRNNFIAEKIAYAKYDDATGIHVVNLVDLYHDETGSSITTAKEFMKDKDAMMWATATISLFSSYLTKMSKAFNTAGYDRFTPKDRQVLLLLSSFDKRARAMAQANTFNPEYISLPNYDTVPYWQSPKSTTGLFSFDEVSSIDIKTAKEGETVTESGIIGLLADKWAIMETIRSKRNAVKRFEPEALTTTFVQTRLSLSNDLTCNGIVFTLTDRT